MSDSIMTCRPTRSTLSTKCDPLLPPTPTRMQVSRGWGLAVVGRISFMWTFMNNDALAKAVFLRSLVEVTVKVRIQMSKKRVHKHNARACCLRD